MIHRADDDTLQYSRTAGADLADTLGWRRYTSICLIPKILTWGWKLMLNFNHHCYNKKLQYLFPSKCFHSNIKFSHHSLTVIKITKVINTTCPILWLDKELFRFPGLFPTKIGYSVSFLQQSAYRNDQTEFSLQLQGFTWIFRSLIHSFINRTHPHAFLLK